jgi:23S rRNA (uracil1939-C5)-methyltransferase
VPGEQPAGMAKHNCGHHGIQGNLVTTIGERIALRPHAMSYRGTAVARHGGQVVFVEGALPGESVIAEIERGRRDFLEAQTVEVVEPSPARVAPRCAHFGKAGSCEWEFIAYAEQLRLKAEILSDQLRRVGHFAEPPVLDAVPSPSAWAYRNHVHFAVDAAGNPVYLRRASHDPVPVDACAVLCPQIDAVLPLLQGRLRGLGSVELRYGMNTGEMLIAPSLDGRGIDLLSGQESYHEQLLGRSFRISAGSFFQVNTGAAELLAQLVLDALQLTGKERIADLYAGVGTFACLIAPHAEAVYAVESEAQAVEDGRLNSGFLENVRYRKGLVEQVLPGVEPAPDAVVLDPPRAGCDRRVIEALLDGKPQRIVYCSCDTATLARDLRLLVDGGYRLVSTRVIDMFPQTYHVESLSVLER